MEKKYILLLAVLLIMPQLAITQQITLNRAVETAINNSDKIKQYSEKIQQKKNSYNESKGNFLPSISLTAGVNHMNDELALDLEPIREVMIKMQAGNQVEFANIYNILQGGSGLTQSQRDALYNNYSNSLNGIIPLFKGQLKKQDYWSTTLIGAQPLFLGGKLFAAKNIASLDVNLAETELLRAKNEVISEVITNYLRVVLLTELVRVREDVLEGMIKHRNDAKRIYEEGIVARNQYLRSEVAVSDAERNLSDDMNRLNLAFIALKNSMNVENINPIQIKDSLIYVNTANPPEFYKKSAAENQPVLKMLELKKEQVSEKLKIDRSEFLPKISLFGKYEIMDEYLSILEPRWIVGIHGSINIFNGFKDYQKIEMTKHAGKEVEYLESDTKSKIDLLIEKNYTDMLNAKTRYEKLESSINLAEENLRFTEGRFLTGMSTSLDVIDAVLVREKTLIERKMSLFEYYISLNELCLSSGKPLHFLKIWNKEI